jgi:peptide methionine sulfoxide reductase MsrB
MKTKTFLIIQTNKSTGEKILFGEIKAKEGDAMSMKHMFPNGPHTYQIFDKKYCINNDINPFDN